MLAGLPILGRLVPARLAVVGPCEVSHDGGRTWTALAPAQAEMADDWERYRGRVRKDRLRAEAYDSGAQWLPWRPVPRSPTSHRGLPGGWVR